MVYLDVDLAYADPPLTGVSVGEVCSCKPAMKLLQNGYFPSAPSRPTYAFDVNMLEFIRELHLRSPPNKTAWSATLEAFLTKQGFRFEGQDAIRRNLAMSLKWFAYLRVAAEIRLQKQVSDVLLEGAHVEQVDEADSEDWEDVGEDGLEYLVRSCPACFSTTMEAGGER